MYSTTVRKIASAVFATPPTSTYEEALAYFKKAEETEPSFYSMNLKYPNSWPCYIHVS
jgi:hypothetical protein